MSDSEGFQLRVFVCQNALANRQAADKLRELAPSREMRVERVPCLGRIDPRYLLKAFEAGYDALCLIGCPEGECLTMDGNLRARRRVVLVNRLLSEIGINEQRLSLYLREPMDEDQIHGLIDELLASLRRLGVSELKSRKALEET